MLLYTRRQLIHVSIIPWLNKGSGVRDVDISKGLLEMIRKKIDSIKRSKDSEFPLPSEKLIED